MLRLHTPICALLLLVACQPADAPYLELVARPSSIDGRGATTTLTATAFRRPDVPGAGTVRLSSAVGTLATPVSLDLDGSGVASTPFSCVTATQPACTGRVLVTADWIHDGAAVSAEVRVQILPGGATGGGAAGGGAAGGGAAGGGSAGGGSAGGGSAGGGSAGGGSAGGGSAGGGSAGGGAAGGGAAGGGSADGGSSSGRFAAPVINPLNVIVFGGLNRGVCEGAVAEFDAGSQPFVGVPCGLNPTLAWLRADGGVVYQHPTTGRVLAAAADALGSTSSGWRYPASVEANDVDLTPTCSTGLRRFLLRPSGAVVGECLDAGWVEQGAPLPTLMGADVVAFHGSGHVLLARGNSVFIQDPAGAERPATLPFMPIPKMTRANAQGFLAAGGPSPCSLYQLNLDGTSSKVGDYTTTGSIGTLAACNGRIDASGVLFIGFTNIGGSELIRRPLAPGVMTVAHGMTSAPTVWDFGPRFNLQLYDGSGMISAP